MAARLKTRRPALSAAAKQGRYLSLDVAVAMSNIEGKLDESSASKLFEDMLGRATDATTREKARVVLFGETVAAFWERGNFDAVMFWNGCRTSWHAHIRSRSAVAILPEPFTTREILSILI